MIAYMEAVHMGVRGLITDTITGDPIYATISVAGNPHPVYSDGDVGDYHRLLLPGTYDVTISADGYSSRTITGVTVEEGTTARLDVQLTPLGEGITFSGGVWSGQIAVNGVDSGVRVEVAQGTEAESHSNSFAVVSGPVVELAFAPLPSTEYSDVPFEVTLSAVDENGFVAGDYAQTFTLQATAGGVPISVSPAGGTFENGTWSGSVTISDVAEEVVLIATTENLTAQMDAFEIVLRPPLAIAISGEASEGDGLIDATISLPQAAVGDVVVTVTSDDPTELVPVQQSVTIPSGQISVPVQFAVADDAGLDGTHVVTIGVSAEDYLEDWAEVAIPRQ